MNIRKNAREMGLLKYNSGRPCRSGHTSDRYVSNGCCIACQNGDAELARAEVMKSRQRQTLAREAECRPFTVLVKQAHQEMFTKLAETLQYSTVETAMTIQNYINALYLAAPTERALTRDDLLTVIDFRDGVVHNSKSLPIIESTPEDPYVYITLHERLYRGDECMEVLHGKRLNVKPLPRKMK